MRAVAIVGLVALSAIFVSSCSEADTVDRNLRVGADQFEVDRRITFVNGITDEYLLTIEGKCSFENLETQVTVLCKDGEDSYKRHTLGLSDNVTFVVEQTESQTVDPYHYRLIFRPETIVPDIELDTSG